MARKINAGSLLTGTDPIDGSSAQYVSLVSQYMATDDDLSRVHFVRARIAAVVGTRGVLGVDGEPLKMADVAAEWGVAPSTFSNAKRSFGVLSAMGFDVHSANVTDSTVKAHGIVKDRMRKFASAKVRVTLANGQHATGKDAHAAIVDGVAKSGDSDDVKFNVLSSAVDGVKIDTTPATAQSDRETFLDALATFQTASDAFLTAGGVLDSAQSEFLSTALATIATAHEQAAATAGK